MEENTFSDLTPETIGHRVVQFLGALVAFRTEPAGSFYYCGGSFRLSAQPELTFALVDARVSAWGRDAGPGMNLIQWFGSVPGNHALTGECMTDKGVGHIYMRFVSDAEKCQLKIAVEQKMAQVEYTKGWPEILPRE